VLHPWAASLGCVLGLRPWAASLAWINHSNVASMSALQAGGTGGIVAGIVGMTLGFAALVGKAYSASTGTNLPMNDEGIEQRVDRLKRDYLVRSMDFGVWGIAAMGAAMAIVGGLANLGFSTGLWGGLQAIGFASGVASVLTMGYAFATKSPKTHSLNSVGTAHRRM
jgi:hypothetical protein